MVHKRDTIEEFAQRFRTAQDENEDILGISGLQKPYGGHVWVYAAVSALARNVAQPPFRLYSDPERKNELPDEHWAVRLFNNPNPLMQSGYELWYSTATFLNLSGDLLWVPVPGRPGEIAELWPFSGSQAKEEIKDGRFFGWTVTWGRQRFHFDPGEVLFFRYFNPYNPVRGMAPLSAARNAIDQDWWANKYNEGFFKNFAEAGTVITFPGEPSTPVLKKTRESWDQRHRGFGNAKRTAVLWGDAKITELGMSRRDMQFLEQKRYSREEILATFKVPPVEVMLIDVVSSRVESQAAQRRQFGEEVIAPEIRMLEDRVNSWFQQMELGIWGFFDTSEVSILQESLGEKIAKAKDLIGMNVPLNEVIRKLDLGVAEQPWGDVAYVPATLVPITALTDGSTDQKSNPSGPEPKSAQPSLPPSPTKLLLEAAPRQQEQEGAVDDGAPSCPDPRKAECCSSASSKKLQRILFELRNEALNEKDGGPPVKWERAERRLAGVVKNPKALVSRLKCWMDGASKEHIKQAYLLLKKRVGEIADREEGEPTETAALDREAIWRQYEGQVLGLERKLERSLTSYLRELEIDYLAAFRGSEAGFERASVPNLDWDEQDRKIEKASRPALEKTVTSLGKCELLLTNLKAERAKTTHVPMTRVVRRKAEKEARKVADIVGGEHTLDNEPMDIIKGKNGIEVKTLVQQKNDKITMHPESLRRKLEYVESHKLKGHTVVVDIRGKMRQLYYAPGFGSFRIGSMRKVTETELRRLIR